METRYRDVSPLLMRFALLRSGCSQLPGYYDDEAQVWMVKTSRGDKPIVETAEKLKELSTKTDVRQEEDDYPNVSAALEFETKTMVRQESDD